MHLASYKYKELERNNVPLLPMPGTRPLDRKLLDLMEGLMAASSMAADSVSNDKGKRNFMVIGVNIMIMDACFPIDDCNGLLIVAG